MTFEIGQIVTAENYTQAAIACNKAGDRHIQLQDGCYVIAANPKPAGLTLQEQLRLQESQTGLTRAVRELVLAANSGVSDYVKQQAQEIENRALPLRCQEEKV